MKLPRAFDNLHGKFESQLLYPLSRRTVVLIPLTMSRKAGLLERVAGCLVDWSGCVVVVVVVVGLVGLRTGSDDLWNC